jgi:branched-subunit amino acid aminotransferase/4-amino-4-deoxychorismate lyase
MKIREYEAPSGPVRLLLDRTISEIPAPFQSGIKSLDYNLYRRKTTQAMESGAWDSIIVAPNGLICEGGRSTLYFYTDHWVTPRLNVVHGIIRSQLVASGQVKEADLGIADLGKVRSIAVSNALVGIKPCLEIIGTSGEIIWVAKNDINLPSMVGNS